jgi:hypothetical protein
MKSRRKFIRAASLLVASAGVMGYHVAHSEKNVLSLSKTKAKGMLQHNVYFWLKDGVSESEKKAFEKGIKDFVGAIKEVNKAEIGIPADTPARDVVDHSFGYSLFTWFTSMENHNIYQEHPAHKKFIEDFSTLWAKVQVYDSVLV